MPLRRVAKTESFSSNRGSGSFHSLSFLPKYFFLSGKKPNKNSK